MAKSFDTLLNAMSPERRANIEEQAQSLLIEMALQELRQARHLTQQQLAETLKLNQAAISKMERQSDMYISTLRRFLKAMGAELKIIASFPDRDVLISQFEEIEEPQQEAVSL